MIQIIAPGTPVRLTRLPWLGATVLAAAPVSDERESLLPAERLAIQFAVRQRAVEYATARCLARQALRALDGPAHPILKDDDGVPLWPPGFSGALSHCRHQAVAVVTTESVAVGVDVQCTHCIKDPLRKVLFRPGEIVPGDTEPRLTLCFSAKEAVYKAVYPVTRTYADFQDVRISPGRDGHGFETFYYGPSGPNELMAEAEGFAAASGGHVMTLALVHRAAASTPRLPEDRRASPRG